MKNKYERLSKHDKMECRNLYYATSKGKEMRLRLIRLTITGVIGLLFSIYLVGQGVLQQNIHWYDYLVFVPLLIASFIFLVGSFVIRKKVLNQFAIKIPKFKNK